MEMMARCPDKYFDLAIVDPPYGIGKTWTKNNHSPFYTHKSSYKNIIPGKDYFDELFRVSDKQIIWGANYYTRYLPEKNSWIIWDKQRGAMKFNSDCELAWTSFNKVMRIARFQWDGFNVCCPRYGAHPHEKPVLLYKWLLQNYAQPGWKILDTHMGSGSIAIACIDLGFELTASEIDPDYYNSAMERIRIHQAQGIFLFPADPLPGERLAETERKLELSEPGDPYVGPAGD
jgi:site-specific DNA-methyltransferase (adenine-specific)